MTEVQLAFGLDGYPTIFYFDGSANALAKESRTEYDWPGEDPDEVCGAVRKPAVWRSHVFRLDEFVWPEAVFMHS